MPYFGENKVLAYRIRDCRYDLYIEKDLLFYQIPSKVSNNYLHKLLNISWYNKAIFSFHIKHQKIKSEASKSWAILFHNANWSKT